MAVSPQTYGVGLSTEPQHIDWSAFHQGQKNWPIPRVLLLVGFFLLGIAAPLFGGRIGIVCAFLLSACFPTIAIRKYFASGNIVKLISIVACVMMFGNLDALGDLLGSEVFRFSWFSLVLAAIAIVAQLKLLTGRVVGCCIALFILIAFHLLTTLGNTSLIRAVELNGSYLAAFLLGVICLVRQNTRDALVMQLSLFTVLNCGFCLFEILFPASQVTISSSRIGDETVRSAGIYANAIVSGVMVSGFLLLATVSCTRVKPRHKEKLALLVFTGICGIGVLVTFSRSAAIVFFAVAVLVAFRLSNNRFAKLSQYLPFAFGLAILSFFGLGEYLIASGSLRTDASKRYEAVKDVLTGDLSPAWTALNERTSAWEPSKKLWRRPKMMGYGYNYVAENGIYPPHNMVVLILAETGIVGLVLVFALLFYFFNIGNWKPTTQNLVLFLSVLLPIMLLLIESHSLFIRRYFALPLVQLVFTTNVLFSRKAVNR